MTCRPVPTASASSPSRIEPAISAIATLTCSGTATPAGVSIFCFWYFLVTAVPCRWCLGGRPTPTSRPVRAGDRHLNFHETRDNLSRRPAGSRWRPPWSAPAPPGGGAPAASPESSCPNGAWGSPRPGCRRGCRTPGAVAVAGVDPLGRAGAVLGAADRVGLGGHEGVDEGPEHLPQQIRAGLGQLLVQKVGRIDTARSGHRVELLKDCGRSPEDHAVAASTFRARCSP